MSELSRLWDAFAKSGSPAKYLKYCREKERISNAADSETRAEDDQSLV